LFNNAGLDAGGSFLADPRSQWELTFNVCWGGVYNCCRAFLPMLMGSKQGAIVNTSSLNGLWANIGMNRPHTAYAAAKYAVKGFTEGLVTDLRVHAPHVSASLVCPGIISTNIAANSIRYNPKPGKVPTEALLAKASAGQKGMETAGHALPSADAASIIIDGVRNGRWRILVGEDCAFIDAKARAEPENAYGFQFWDEILEAGHLHRVESRARTDTAREAHSRGVTVAALVEEQKARL
jgi:NAD(P)-dependent dehydrogenase (short-subunit alcohol dehydrogenase family)